jgi:tetratricopeptide (TPR) repeat protein
MPHCLVHPPEELTRYLRGELPPDVEQTLEEHVEDCTLCLAELRKLEADRSDTLFPAPSPAGDVPDPPEEVMARLLREWRAAAPGLAAPPALPRYEVRGLLGRGGMGAVWHAFDRELKREVALKTLPPPEETEGTELARLLGEAEAIARLDHEGIVRIYDKGMDQGRPFLSLEFCPGGSLDERLRRAGGPLPPPVAAVVVEAVARAVGHAHARGVLHRDLKPANVLLVDGPETPLEQCRLKVADFGLAKRVDVAGPTVSGALLGTPAYMAPEQVLGDKHIGPAADVHALGVLFYQLLTGRLPYQGANTHEILLHIVHDDPAQPRRLRPGLAPDLETICLKCLEKAPGRRYASAGELADDLGRWRTGEPIRARPPSTGRRLRRWLGRRRMTLAVLAVLAVAVAAASAVAWQRAQNERAQQQQQERYARAQEEERQQVARAQEQKRQEGIREKLRETLRQVEEHKYSPEGATQGADLQRQLEQHAAEYEQVVLPDATDPAARLEFGDLQVRLGWLEAVYGDKANALARIEKGRTIFTEVSADPAATSARVKLGNACNDLGLVLVLLSRPDQARTAYDDAIHLHEQLVADTQGSKDFVGSLLNERLNDRTALGDLLLARGDYAGAEAAFAQVCKDQAKRIAADPANPGRGTPQAGCLARWGAALDALHRTEEARGVFEEAVAVLDRLFPPGSLKLVSPQKPAAPPTRASTLQEFLATSTAWGSWQKLVDHYSDLVARRVDSPGDKRHLARSRFFLAMSGFATDDKTRDNLGIARQGTTLYEDLCRTEPRNGALALEGAQLASYTAMYLLMKQRSSEEIARWCDQGLGFLDGAMLAHEQKAPAEALRADLCFVRAHARFKQGRHLEVLRDLEEVYRCEPATRTWDSATTVYALSATLARGHLVRDLMRRGRHQEAVAETEALAQLPSIPGEALYDGACAYGVAAGASTDPKVREQYAARCVVLLRRAFAAGFGKDLIQRASNKPGDPVQNMERDTDLAAVRDRADYKQLVADLTRKP